MVRKKKVQQLWLIVTFLGGIYKVNQEQICLWMNMLNRDIKHGNGKFPMQLVPLNPPFGSKISQLAVFGDTKE